MTLPSQVSFLRSVNCVHLSLEVALLYPTSPTSPSFSIQQPSPHNNLLYTATFSTQQPSPHNNLLHTTPTANSTWPLPWTLCTQQSPSLCGQADQIQCPAQPGAVASAAPSTRAAQHDLRICYWRPRYSGSHYGQRDPLRAKRFIHHEGFYRARGVTLHVPPDAAGD